MTPGNGGNGKDTKQRILDAAERLFAEHGFAGTSLRNITTSAEVNLAAVNYHFGSKDSLIESVFQRRLGPLNRERLRLLDAVEHAPRGEHEVESIVEAFIGPPLRMSRDRSKGGAVFMRLLGFAMSQPADHIRQILAGQFREVITRFAAAMKHALPALDDREILYRMLFMAGSMSHTMAISDQMNTLSRGICSVPDADELILRMTPFLASALRAPAGTLEKDGAS